jgi:non-ribosomal peptide synthetase component F
LCLDGPTETTIWSSCYLLSRSRDKKLASAPLPIGKPVSATDFYLVVEADGVRQRLASFGEEGELWIGGAGVAAGYLNAPDLTRDKFIANPFGKGTVYRTGDVVKQTEVMW